MGKFFSEGQGPKRQVMPDDLPTVGRTARLPTRVINSGDATTDTQITELRTAVRNLNRLVKAGLLGH